MMLYPTRGSGGHWLVIEAAPTGVADDDNVFGRHASQREALNACGRSWFTVNSICTGGDASNWTIEENRVGEARTETTIHDGLSGGEAHRLKARLVAAGVVYIEGIVT